MVNRAPIDPAPSAPGVAAWDYRELLAATEDGQFWIGSTEKGRRSVDCVPNLAHLIEWAIIGREAAFRELQTAIDNERS